MPKNTFSIIKKILITILFTILCSIIILLFSKDNDLIRDVKGFIEKDTKVLYITSKDKYSEYPIKLFDKYDIKYLYVDSTKLSSIEKTKIEKIVNSKYTSNILVIFNNGEIVDAIIDYESENDLDKFLQKHSIIPQVIGDIDGIIESVSELLETELTMLYIPYKYVDGIETQSEVLKEISTRYKIEYKLVNAYLLSSVQQEKLNSILHISSVEDQIIILVKDKKIVGSIRGINKANYYLDELQRYNFIEKVDNYINKVDYDKFNELINSNNKNIILIGKDECRYCDNVVDTLNSITVNYNIPISYINVGKLDSELSNNVEKKLIELGYSDGFTTPIIIMTESNRLIDYVIGPSNEEYFVDIFTENGIIK